MPAKIIIFKNKKIVFFDFQKCRANEDMIEELRSGAHLLRDTPDVIGTFSDFTDQFIVNAFMEELTLLNKSIFGKHNHKAAAIGINNIKLIFLQSYNSLSQIKVKSFETKEDALEYLVAD